MAPLLVCVCEPDQAFLAPRFAEEAQADAVLHKVSFGHMFDKSAIVTATKMGGFFLRPVGMGCCEVSPVSHNGGGCGIKPHWNGYGG